MAHTFDSGAFVTAYDTNTGKKLGLVPRTHIDIFPHLSLTPKAKAVMPKPKEIVSPVKAENKTEKEG